MVAVLLFSFMSYSYAEPLNKEVTQDEIAELFDWAEKNDIDIFMLESEEQADAIIRKDDIKELKKLLLDSKKGFKLKPMKKDNPSIVNKEQNKSDDMTIQSDVFFYDNQVYTHRGFIMDTDGHGLLEMGELEARVRYSYYLDTFTGEKQFHNIDYVSTYLIGTLIFRSWSHQWSNQASPLYLNMRKRVQIEFEGIATLGVSLGSLVVGTNVYCYGDFQFSPADPNW